jgi:segregation and condensation protein B
MDYFGINSINELPQMKDFTNNEVSIGEQSE